MDARFTDESMRENINRADNQGQWLSETIVKCIQPASHDDTKRYLSMMSVED